MFECICFDVFLCYRLSMRLALINLKGGVAKTTSSIYLATSYAAIGPTALLDADPQGSASDWAASIEDDGDNPPFEVIVANQRTLDRAGNEHQFVIVDTPPGDPRVIDAAIATADIVLIPTEASPIDVQRVWPAIEAATRAGKPAAVLLVRARPNTRSLAAAVEALEDAGVAVLEARIPLREEIKAAYGTIPKRLHGYDSVAADLLEVHNGNA